MDIEQPSGGERRARRAGSPILTFFAAGEPSRRRLLGVGALGTAAFALLIASLYVTWDDQTGRLVDDPVNLWFNCILLAAFALILLCISRPRHRSAGAVAFVGLTIGMFYVVAENGFGMFTYNDANPAAGFWLGLASYAVQILAAIYAGLLVGDECCGGVRPDGRPRNPSLVLGLGVLGIGWLVARFLPDFVITVHRAPVSESGNALSEGIDPDIHYRGMVARLDGAEFIPELTGWAIFLLAAPLAAWVLRRQLAAALVSGFLVYFIADIVTALAIDYSLDYSEDLDNGLRVTVDYGLGDGFLALVATTALFIIAITAVYFSGPDQPAPGEAPATEA
jgi:hypothetical protein